MSKKEKVVHYQNEQKDDFANNNIKVKKIKDTYKYISKNPINRAFSWLIWFLLMPIAKLIGFILYHPKVVGKKNIKSIKKQGYYIYSNHVLSLDPILTPTITNIYKKCYIAASQDTFSICGFVSWIVKALGAFPVPTNSTMYYNYVDFIKHVISKKKRVLMYPEAHIWPYCNFIRDYSDTSFKYPVMTNSPIVPYVTCFTKRKHSNKPKITVYILEPIYPNTNLSLEDSTKDLRDRTFKLMDEASKKYSTYEYVKYIKD